MMYVTLAGLEQYLGEAAWADWLVKHPAPEASLAGCEAKMLAVILPNRPETEGEIAAFSRAVYAQLEQDASGMALPEGVKKFSLGSWSAEIGGGGPCCAAARAELLNAGLLTRSVPLC